MNGIEALRKLLEAKYKKHAAAMSEEPLNQPVDWGETADEDIRKEVEKPLLAALVKKRSAFSLHSEPNSDAGLWGKRETFNIDCDDQLLKEWMTHGCTDGSLSTAVSTDRLVKAGKLPELILENGPTTRHQSR